METVSRMIVLLAISWCASAAPPDPSGNARTDQPSASPSSPRAPTDGPCESLLSGAEKLYQQQQFDAAQVIVKEGLGSCLESPSAFARLYMLKGVLDVEAFEDVEAQSALAAALSADETITFPAFGPPRARRMFEELKAKRAQRGAFP